MQSLQQSNVDAITQTIKLIDGLSDSFYRRSTVNGLSGAGSHVRHILDHYRALICGCDSGLIDYDNRNRDCASACNRVFARREMCKISDWLRAYQGDDKSLNISTEITFDGAAPITLSTTISRELCYLLNHTVHHTAYIALLVRHAGFCVDDSVGVAPASRSFQRQQAAGAQR